MNLSFIVELSEMKYIPIHIIYDIIVYIARLCSGNGRMHMNIYIYIYEFENDSFFCVEISY